MDFLCAIPFLTPDAYLRLLRLIPLLGTVEIGFELIGEESFRRGAERMLDWQGRVREWAFPRRMMAPFEKYLDWGLHIALTLLQQVNWIFNPAGAWQEKEKRDEEKARATLLEPYRKMSMEELLATDERTFRKALDARFPTARDYDPINWEFTGKQHLAYGLLTLAGLAGLFWLATRLHLPLDWLLSQFEPVPAGEPWYRRLPQDFMDYVGFVFITALAIALFTLLLYGLAWLAQKLLEGLIALSGWALQKIARALSQDYKRTYKTVLFLTLLATILTVFLPNELFC
jgi:hypothetical protein